MAQTTAQQLEAMNAKLDRIAEIVNDLKLCDA